MTARFSLRTAVLSEVAGAAHKSERVILRRYPQAERELAGLLRDGLVEYHDDACTAVHVTAAGRAELKRLRDAAALKGAA